MNGLHDQLEFQFYLLELPAVGGCVGHGGDDRLPSPSALEGFYFVKRILLI